MATIKDVAALSGVSVTTVSRVLNKRGLKDWGATYAAIALSILPTLAIYFTLNKKMTAGMTLGAVKS